MNETASLKSASLPGTGTSTGTKRKRNPDPKFYAVRVGYHPGIYHTWADCLEQIKGFKKATFKSFSTLTDAESFLAGKTPSPGLNSLTTSLSKFYAVKCGRIPGIYTDWPSAQQQITGWTKPRHKCFATRIEAQKFLDEEVQKGNENLEADHSIGSIPLTDYNPESFTEDLAKPSTLKKAKKGSGGNIKTASLEYNERDYEAGMGPLPPGTEDGFDSNIILNPETGQVVYKTQLQRQAMKLEATGSSQTDVLRIHTDGSSLGNGTVGAFAGVGVYFGPGDERNISEALTGIRQTNQRAELTAILRALEIVPRNRDVSIITDSRYAIDCVTLWYINWRKNGWKNSSGKPVENKDLVENILAKIEERDSLKVQTAFEWIKGHANHLGNVEADKLAVNGARKNVL